MNTTRQAIAEAIKEAGGHAAVAQKLGISRQAVYRWEHDGITAERARELHDMSGYPLEKLRPDLWP